MNSKVADGEESRLRKIQQAVKWTVYILLIINFVYYVFEDWNRAVHTLNAQSTLLDWTSEFATSIDESAWFILLFMFELETYIIDDDKWTGWLARTAHGARLVCYAMLAHTVYAFSLTIINLQPTIAVDNATHLCDLVGREVSYVYNLEYTDVTEASCAGLSDASKFYWVADDPVISDMEGLNLERDLAWADLAEVIIWLVILAAIELVVRLQDKGITASTLMTAANRTKIVLYLSLIGIGLYWASLSHWLYLWDELVWIGGFAAIEMNINQWNDELQANLQTA